jgi:hypothetical protein
VALLFGGTIFGLVGFKDLAIPLNATAGFSGFVESRNCQICDYDTGQ